MLSNFYIGCTGGPHPEFNDIAHDPDAPVSLKMYVARQPTGAGPHDTPPQKVIVRGDHFLHSAEHAYYSGMPGYSPPSPIKPHLYDVGFAARAPQSSDEHADEHSNQDEHKITIADLSKPIFSGRRRPETAAPGHLEDCRPAARVPPPTDPFLACPPSRPAQAPTPAERGHTASPTLPKQTLPHIVPDTPDPNPDPERSTASSPVLHPEHTTGGPGPGDESASGQVHGPRSHSGLDTRRAMLIVPQEGPAGARCAPRRAASSAIAPGTFTNAQAESDLPPSEDEFQLSNTPLRGWMRLFEELDDGGTAFDIGNDDDHADHPAPPKVKSTHKSRPALPRSAESDSESDADANDCDKSDTRPRHQDKGKRAQHNTSAGPSHSSGGCPPVKVNQEIEQVAHRMQAEIVQLSHKVGMSYETLLRKMGFTQQEVRDPNLKSQSVTQYNTAFKAWQAEHGNDAAAVAALFKEHATILTSDEFSGKPTEKITKMVAMIAQQMAKMSNSYFMAGNIAVVGAVINLSSADAAQMFAPTIGHQAALVKGFEYDEHAALLKAKSLLILEADETDLTENKGPKWEFRKWPALADVYQLVLTGWGPDMPTLPGQGWVDKSAGTLTGAQWKTLIAHIPADYHHNPFHTLPEGQLPLDIIMLDNFLLEREEYQGRSPCVADETGHAVLFIDEQTKVLRGTGKKRQARSRGGRTQPKSTKKESDLHSSEESAGSDHPVRPAPQPARRRVPTPPATEPPPQSGDENDVSDPTIIEQSRERLLRAARTSPSGHVKKRVRTATSTHEPESPPRAGHYPPSRPIKPLPQPVSKELKRKHVDLSTSAPRVLPTTQHTRPQHPQAPSNPPGFRAHMGPAPARMPAPAGMYHPSFNPQAFGPPPLYPAEGYMPPVYAHPAYPQPYAPQGWNHPSQHPLQHCPHEPWLPGPEPWLPGASRYNPEDGDHYNPNPRWPYGS
ncbi:hypothetical protein FIBSPDRAFT_943418 [Athelia psychrophila]|uniref:Uncharacterized protein n=1 Tax=Athelia psychrophila TaxID=1759441 RepID=A0A166WD09_9AGAM|nr:hypothetical protein FIBSPDRAFT_943418 [Fibularhizoctonia sp. CBS 109695]